MARKAPGGILLIQARSGLRARQPAPSEPAAEGAVGLWAYERSMKMPAGASEGRHAPEGSQRMSAVQRGQDPP